MESRLHMSTEFYLIQFPDTEEGMEQAKNFRKETPLFKGRRIKKVIQAFPSTINCGEIYMIENTTKEYFGK